MKTGGRGKQGKMENSQMPGFINQKQHKRNTHTNQPGAKKMNSNEKPERD